MTIRARVLPSLVLVLVLSACSGDGDGDGAEQATAGDDGPTYEQVREAYVEQASAVCEEADAAFAALPTPTTPASFGPYVQDTVRIAETAQAELSALTPPERDRAELQREVLDPFAALVSDGRAFAERVAAAGTDQVQLLALLSEQPTSADIDLELLRSYGLGTCADAIAQAG